MTLSFFFFPSSLGPRGLIIRNKKNKDVEMKLTLNTMRNERRRIYQIRVMSVLCFFCTLYIFLGNPKKLIPRKKGFLLFLHLKSNRSRLFNSLSGSIPISELKSFSEEVISTSTPVRKFPHAPVLLRHVLRTF